jgi:hypothetical protein
MLIDRRILEMTGLQVAQFLGIAAEGCEVLDRWCRARYF